MTAPDAAAQAAPTSGSLLASGLVSTIGAAIGPDGALYVPEGGIGGTTAVATDLGDVYPSRGAKITRIDPATGAKSVVLSNIPTVAFEPGGPGSGVVDVAFVGNTMYFLNSLHGPLAGAAGGLMDFPSGIYKATGASTFTLVADIGQFTIDHPVAFPDASPGGNVFSFVGLGTDFYVTDGNHNRVYRVTAAGVVTELATFGNVVPTGTAIQSAAGPLYISQIGPGPFLPADGKVRSINVTTGVATDVASGVSFIIDVEFGPGGQLYALTMGTPNHEEGDAPAVPFTGKLLKVNANGTFSPIVNGLNLPTSLDFSGDTAFVTTLAGEVWKISGVAALQPIATTSPTATATASATASATTTATATATTTASATATTATPTATPTRTATPTQVATVAPSPTPTQTTAPTATPTRAAPQPPNTGDGQASGGSTSSTLGIAALLAIAGLAATGLAIRRR